MKNARFTTSRRALLGGAASAAVTTMLRPLVQAAEGGRPVRLLLIHKPCGTIPARWMPTGNDAQFELGPILKPFEPLKRDMTLFRAFTAPRDPKEKGDKHAGGMIAFLTGKNIVPLPGQTFDNNDAGNIASPDRTVDQLLAARSPLFQGTTLPSIQLAAYGETVPPFWPQTRVVSWSGPAKALAPEIQPAKAYARIFGAATGQVVDSAALMRARAQKKSVLDFLRRDLDRLAQRVPASQRGKMDEHLEGIRQLERTLDATPAATAASCGKPAIDTSVGFAGGWAAQIDKTHEPISKAHLAIVKAAFQCDVTRVAVFSYAQGNSIVRFADKIPNLGSASGHHDMSHNSGATNPLSLIDTWYSERVAQFLVDLKNTPDGPGTSLLDNTLVVYFSEVSLGWSHWHENLPFVFIGGAGGRLRTGRVIDGGGKYTSEVWRGLLPLFGVTDPFGDPAWGQGVLGGLGA